MKTKFATYIQLYSKSLSEFFKASPLYALIMFFLIPVQSILPAVIIASSQALLSALTTGNPITNSLIVWGISVTAARVFSPIVTLTQGLLTDRLVAHINSALMLHSKKLKGISAFETASYYDELEFIRSEASWRPVNLIVFGLSLLRDFLTAISYVVLLMQFQWWLTLLVVIPAIPQAFITYRIQQDAFETMVDRSPQSRKMQYYAQVLLTNTDAKEIRMFNAFDFFIKRYQTTFNQIHQQLKSVRFKQMRVSTFFAIVNGTALVVSLYFVVKGISSGQYQSASLLTFTAAVVAFGQNLGALVEETSLLYDSLLFMKKYYSFLHKPDTLTLARHGKDVRIPFEIEFKNVSFVYPETNNQVLQGISFKINAGEKIAIVGENGSGKSTIVKLLLRLYDPSQGTISINRVPLSSLDLDTYRNHIRVVFQDFSKFNLSLRESVQIADPQDGSDADVIRALDKASAYHSFINQGVTLDTHLGKQYEDGAEVSGGQWQKIAISRAFYMDNKAGLAILDEPTAAIDPRSEFEVYQHFSELSKNKTVVFVTHRLSSVLMADRVLFLKTGKLAGFAPHEILMKTNSEYASMYRMQAESYVKGLTK